MKDIWKTIRLGVYVFALPLVATAAASAHQWMTDSNPVQIADLPVATTVSDGHVINNLMQHTITADHDGIVRGRLISIDQKTAAAIGLGELKVYFARNGEIASETATESDGSFEIKGLKTGAYSFIAAGESGFAAYGINVVAGGEGAEPTMMEVAAVSPKFTAVREILKNNVPKSVADEIVALANANNEQPTPIKLEGANRVKIVDGSLVGNLVPIWGENQMIAGTYVHIVKNDKQIAVTQVDESGHFQIPDIAPGVYDFVAAGPAGFAAVGFEAIQEPVAAAADSEVIETAIPESIVEVDAAIMDAAADAQDVVATDIPADAGYVDPSYNIGYADSFDVALTSPQDGSYVGDSVYDYSQPYSAPSIEYAGQAVGCGGACGSSCGGCGDSSGYGNCCGGSAGGGGRFWKILGIAGFALGLAAIIDNGDQGMMTAMQPN
jgi:hypothetical protein